MDLFPTVDLKALLRFPGCLILGCLSPFLLLLASFLLPAWAIIWLFLEAQKRSHQNLLTLYQQARRDDPDLEFDEFVQALSQR